MPDLWDMRGEEERLPVITSTVCEVGSIRKNEHLQSNAESSRDRPLASAYSSSLPLSFPEYWGMV